MATNWVGTVVAGGASASGALDVQTMEEGQIGLPKIDALVEQGKPGEASDGVADAIAEIELGRVPAAPKAKKRGEGNAWVLFPEGNSFGMKRIQKIGHFDPSVNSSSAQYDSGFQQAGRRDCDDFRLIEKRLEPFDPGFTHDGADNRGRCGR